VSIETIATTTVSWLWDQYGKNLADKAFNRFQKKWREFHWDEAEAMYRSRLRKQHNTTRLLGHPKLITIEDIFTDVYVLDQLTAYQRFELSELQALPFDRQVLHLKSERRPILRMIINKERLFILGKPGSGKTTLLKFVLLQACVGKIAKTPIFVSMKEWADSGLELMPFLLQQFEICAFPDAQEFITHLLEKGSVLVLFDGLDEVNQEGSQRLRMIMTLKNFSKRYPLAHICVTCRIAATDYSFDDFTYLEIADFDDRQIQLFSGKWYQNDQLRHGQFISEFNKPEQMGLRELARTPLLLALLCLAFDEIGYFPARRVDLYKESLDALLKKWDASRGIQRDEIYRRLSPVRKEQLLARVAAQNFEAGLYFVQQEKLAGQVALYLQKLPTSDVGELLDGEAILRAIETQHGILVERAHGIYSFSHLTFQEYLTARYVVDNAAGGTIARLVNKHLTDDRWREVFLNIASLLDNADILIQKIASMIDNLSRTNDACIALLQWAYSKANSTTQPDFRTRALVFYLGSSFIGDYTGFRPSIQFFAHFFIKAKDRGEMIDLINNLGIKLDADDFEVIHNCNLTEEKAFQIVKFMYANVLLVECLQLAAVSDRVGFESRLLLPPMS